MTLSTPPRGVEWRDRRLSASTVDCEGEGIKEDSPSGSPSSAGKETCPPEGVKQKEPKEKFSVRCKGCLKRVPWRTLTPIFLAFGLAGVLAGTVYVIGPVRVAGWIAAALGVERGEVPSAQGFIVAFVLIAIAFPACLPTGMFEFIMSFFMGWWCLIPAFAGRLAGSTAAFYLGRSCCRRRAGRLLSEFRRLKLFSIVVKEAPYRYLLMLQFTFLPRAVKTYGAAALDVTCPPFVTAIMIASIPGTTMSVATGSTAGDLTAFLEGRQPPNTAQIVLLCAGVVFMVFFCVCSQRAVGRKLKALESLLEEAEKREKMEEGEGEAEREETMRDMMVKEVGEIDDVVEGEQAPLSQSPCAKEASENTAVGANLGEGVQTGNRRCPPSSSHEAIPAPLPSDAAGAGGGSPATVLPVESNGGSSCGSSGDLSSSPVLPPQADSEMIAVGVLDESSARCLPKASFPFSPSQGEAGPV
uniref:VTT domain-containing protein n=1 Tax=Chromera velia CCMP2878 TaxID=1169474 RepID=A0A0G4H1L3_9ALVE|eukprot:Cvel_5541.t1-p1 / transcript=Cvel_5541.t1 / gene=Cvel_5541 / organism=Chromera_velia_CCMP2878 / gene_product=hypothetical protein / transcript_product=hypothetical protein / location=Cvel_scaffold259:99504-102293(+) / protein_length=469 / sequence_SO=supercontig / SO=protein_coding / is_pseudo=false